jgi:predicted dehydrogenase
VGLRHANNLQRLGVKKIGVVRQRNRRLHKAVDLSRFTVYSDIKEAIRSGYDAAVICNPTSHHIDTALMIADAGIHMYIEKPLSHSLAGIDILSKCIRSESSPLVATVGCQFRFHPNLEDIRAWMTDKSIGRIIHICVDTGEFLPSWHPWEDYRKSYASRKDLGGGVVLTLIHEIDYLHWLFGPVRPISAVGGTSGKLELDVEDHATTFMTTSGGTPVVMHLDYLQQPPCRKMKIVGTKGTIAWDYHKNRACEYVDGDLKRNSLLPPEWERNDMFMASMQDFLECVITGKTPKISIEDGIETLRIALSIREWINGHSACATDIVDG